MVIIGCKVSGRENLKMIHFSQYLTCQSLNFTDTINFITEKLYSKSVLISEAGKISIPTNFEIFPVGNQRIIAFKLEYQTSHSKKFYHRNLQDLDAN